MNDCTCPYCEAIEIADDGPDRDDTYIGNEPY